MDWRRWVAAIEYFYKDIIHKGISFMRGMVSRIIKVQSIYVFGFIFSMGIFLSQCTYSGQGIHHYPVGSENAGPQYHTLKEGETLWQVAKKYDVPLTDIIRYNNIDDVTKLPVGKRIYIPSQDELRAENAPDFIWPLKGKVAKGFKRSGAVQYSGIDILSPEGTPVLAAAEGDVIYNGNHMAGYGNMIIIMHRNGFSSVYANNKVNLVAVGEKIKQGQMIAQVGRSGNDSEPHLHFEIRKEKKSVNPYLYLPDL